jgi:hypothetical protein
MNHGHADVEEESSRQLDILSSVENLKFIREPLNETQLINLLSDIKHRLFPRPFERLSPLRGKTNLVGAEIGVCGGEHALSLLRTLSPAKLYCIDPYDLYDSYTEGKNHYGIDQAPLSRTEKCARKLLAEYADRITWIRKLSAEATGDIEESLDFVYIDGNHAEDFVRRDIQEYWPLIKINGILGGHDFYNGFQSEHDGVISAVIEFASKRNLSLKVELPDWWIAKPNPA